MVEDKEGGCGTVDIGPRRQRERDHVRAHRSDWSQPLLSPASEYPRSSQLDLNTFSIRLGETLSEGETWW